MAAAAQHQIQDLHDIRLLDTGYIQQYFACYVRVTDYHGLLHDGWNTFSTLLCRKPHACCSKHV
jgi:hypothetical protein